MDFLVDAEQRHGHFIENLLASQLLCDAESVAGSAVPDDIEPSCRAEKSILVDLIFDLCRESFKRRQPCGRLRFDGCDC